MSEEIKPHVGMAVWRWERKAVILSETSRSWVIGRGWGDFEKVPKKTFPQYPYFLTEQASKDHHDRQQWIWTHAPKIRSYIQFLDDIGQLRQIAAIIGYKEEQAK